jgi:hypothetical protein
MTKTNKQKICPFRQKPCKGDKCKSKHCELVDIKVGDLK